MKKENSKDFEKQQVPINLTLSDYVYESLKKEADEIGISLNQLIIKKIGSIKY